MASSKIVRSPRALDDLDEASAYLYEAAGLDVASRFLDAAEAAFQRLLGMPELGAARERLNPRLPELRMWPLPDFPNYVVYYRPMERGVEVVRVLHASRDRDSILHDDE